VEKAVIEPALDRSVGSAASSARATSAGGTPSILVLLVLLVSSSSQSASGQTVPSSRPRTPASDRPPTVKVEVTTGPTVDEGDEVVVRVTVDDPDGDPVSARLVAGPPRFAMRPIVRERPPVVREMRGFVDAYSGGRQWFDVAAHDSWRPDVVVHGRAPLDVVSYGTHATMRALDVDGDGKLELVAVARHQTIGGVADAGALCVDSFDPSGRVAPAPRLWHAAAPVAGEELGYVQAEASLQQADLDGDGKLDLVAMSSANGGTLHVWFARPNPSALRPADATLTAGALANLDSDLLVVRFHDVTGDGIEDVVAVAPLDSSRVSHGGAVHVFAGGSSMRGAVGPTATLALASPVADDQLGSDGGGVFADVTGDGFDDLVVRAPHADWNGKKDEGVVALFAGGPGLSGSVSPTAVFTGKHAKNRSFGQGPVTAADVTGDGVTDLVASGPTAVGVAYVWNGGSALSGTPAANATLQWSSASVGDAIGQQVQIADVNHDGWLDVVSPSFTVDVNGRVDAGAVMVWNGGPTLSGTLDPTAILGVTVAQTNTFLSGGLGGMRIVDVTGDGALDVVAVAGSTVAGVPDAGALYVWSGAGSISGSPPPDATLTVPGAQPYDALGSTGNNEESFLFGDVTGDGLVDLVVPAVYADVGGAVDAGALYVFEGGSSLTGSVTPCVSLQRASPQAFDHLAVGDDFSAAATAVRIVDVTGDGVVDVVAVSPFADGFGVQDVGALDVWAGGVVVMSPVQPPLAELTGSANFDHLGVANSGVQFGDVNGDGILDLAVGVPGHDEPHRTDVGLGHVLLGGATLVGTPTPYTVLERAHFASNDLLFDVDASSPSARAGAVLLQFADLDGDGRDDVFGAAPSADWFGAADVGVICLWPNGRPPNASSRGPMELWAPGQIAGSFFGE
jgi:hypothetical protein